MIDPRYIYFVSLTPFALVWACLCWRRPDLRTEMLVMGGLCVFMAIASDQYWWTINYWRPENITHTRVPYIEDIFFGVFVGGVAAVLYEVLGRKRHAQLRRTCTHCAGGLTLLLLLASITSWLFWGIGITSFYASAAALLIVACVMFTTRRDLFMDGLLNGLLLVLLSIFSYALILVLSPSWIDHAYLSQYLSGIRIEHVPVEEFIFWFLTGLVIGPLYEYWKGQRLMPLRQKNGSRRPLF